MVQIPQKINAIYYIGSLFARANFIDLKTLKKYLDGFVDYGLSYLENNKEFFEDAQDEEEAVRQHSILFHII